MRAFTKMVKEQYCAAICEVEYSQLRLSRYRSILRYTRIGLAILASVAALGAASFADALGSVGWNWLAAAVTLISTIVIPATDIEASIKNLQYNRAGWDPILTDLEELLNDLRTGLSLPDAKTRLQTIREKQKLIIAFDTQVPLCKKTRKAASDFAQRRADFDVDAGK